MKSDMIEHALDAKTRHAVAADLQAALVELIDLGLCAKHAHWVVVGPRFRSVHLELDELAKVARAAADDVAERSSALGRAPDGTPRTVARGTGVVFPDGFLADDVILRLVAGQLTRVTTDLRTRIRRLDQLDAVSGDLLTEIAHELEKHAWMMQASLHRTAVPASAPEANRRLHGSTT